MFGTTVKDGGIVGILLAQALQLLFEPRREKTALRDFRPGPTQTGLYSHRRKLDD